MLNYSEMTNEELDQLAAEIFYPTNNMKVHNTLVFLNNSDELAPARIKGAIFTDEYSFRWYPTHPDSNQCERYLFPKLQDFCREKPLALFIESSRSINTWEFEIDSIPYDGSGKQILCYYSDITDDQINRTKVIACLEAWDKLK